MTRAFTESTVEDAALAWLESAGWNVAHGPDIAPDTPGAERDVVLERRRRDSPARLNPQLPAEGLEEAFRKLSRVGGAVLDARKGAPHRQLRPEVMLFVDGLAVVLQELENAADGASIRSSVPKRPRAGRRAG